jgi:ectoine hydroxylase-related dioxygenase (phytanoyl-CoA dioxygenase family)
MQEPHLLTSEQLKNYRENGYLVIEGLVSPEEVEELRAETTRLCRGVYPIPGIEPGAAGASDTEALAKYLCIHQPHKVSPVIRRYAAHPGIAAVLAQLIGPNVKCMQSMLFIKPPQFPGQAYHQDERYIPTEDRSLTGAWIALDDATIRNGCLWVIPGSHREEILPWAPHDNPEYDSADEAQGVPREREVPLECPAGAVAFFNGFLLHSSRKNRSDGYRRVLVNHYMSAESKLPWQGREDYRDVFIVHGSDPHAEKGYEDLARPHLRSPRRATRPAS